jgi:predicted nuclease with TOPRIM domain
MGAISMALKDSTLQQGFEIICKNLSELEKENSRLNQIILGNEEEITDLRKDCEEYSKTFNRQNDEIVSLRKKMIKTKEIIRILYFIIQGRIDYKGNIPLEDEMYRAKQFLEKEL